MILDRLEFADRYRALGPRFAAGFEYLRSTDLAALGDGRYEIGGRELVAIVQTYRTKTLAEGRWESHRHHADIQFIIRGRERMGIAARSAGLKVQPPYDAGGDVEFSVADAAVGQLVMVEAGSFAVFFPHDVHMPNLLIDAPAEVKKVVIKVRLD